MSLAFSEIESGGASVPTAFESAVGTLAFSIAACAGEDLTVPVRPVSGHSAPAVLKMRPASRLNYRSDERHDPFQALPQISFGRGVDIFLLQR